MLEEEEVVEKGRREGGHNWFGMFQAMMCWVDGGRVRRCKECMYTAGDMVIVVGNNRVCDSVVKERNDRRSRAVGVLGRIVNAAP